MARFLSIGLVLAFAVTPVFGLEYESIVSWVEANGGGTSTSLFAAFAEGNTAYCQLTANNSPRITRVDALDQPVRVTTELVSTPQWLAVGGSGTGLTSFYGFSSSGDYLQFTDTSTDAIWRVNKSTGAIIPYITKAQMTAFKGGGAEASTLSASDTAPDGEFVWYESNSKQILKSTGLGTMMTLISNPQLTGLMGTVACTSIGVAGDGTTYFTNSTTDCVYKRSTDGTLSTILTPAYINAVTGGNGVTFKDIFPAPDGFVYTQENTTANILRFAPSDPTGTLEIYLSAADLIAGPAAGGTNIYQLSWYQNRLAFNVHSTTGARGFYAVVPEPASLGLLLVGGMALLRRRSR